MSLYLGKINETWVHTYSKKLRDAYLGKDYVVIFTLGTGKSGGIKVRNSISMRQWIIEHEKYRIPVIESDEVMFC